MNNKDLKELIGKLIDLEKKENGEGKFLKVLTENNEDILQVLNCLSEEKLPYGLEIVDSPRYKDGQQKKEVIDIIGNSKNDFNAEYARDVLTNENSIKAGISLEGAKIINESENDFNAEYARDILTNENSIKA